MEDISTILALEVKKELADRYFGFRKIIEDDTTSYLEEIEKIQTELNDTIGADLTRIYHVLQDNNSISEFLNLTALQGQTFLSKYKNQDKTIKHQILADKKIRGFTRRSRLKNSLFDNYKALEKDIAAYNINLEELRLKHKTIQEQIKLFYQKNDLSGMMQFMRGLDMHGSHELTTMAGPTTQKQDSNMEKQLKISPPPPVEDFLPNISSPPPFKTLASELKKLAITSYKQHQNLDLLDFS